MMSDEKLDQLIPDNVRFTLPKALEAAREAGHALPCSLQTYRRWCRDGRIDGAILYGTRWTLPGHVLKRVIREGVPK